MMKTRLLVLAGGSALCLSAAASAGVVGVMCEHIEPQDWIDNGYDTSALDTYRLYVEFDQSGDRLSAVYGQAGEPMSWTSSDGSFYNDAAFDSNTAPLDLTGINVWSNQWDTYATINSTESTPDVILTPGFDTEVGGFAGDFSTMNASWLVTPDNPLGDPDGAGRVLVAQITVAEGVTVDGVINVQDAAGVQTAGLDFHCENIVPAPGALALLGLAGLAGRRRRK